MVFWVPFVKRIHNRLAAASESGLRKPVQEERTGFPPPLYPSFSHSPSNTVRSEQASSWNFPPQVKDAWVANAGLSLSRHNAQAHCPVAPVLPPTSVRPPWVFFFSSPSIQFFQSILSKSCPQEFLLHDFCELKPNLHDFPVKICDESWSIAINLWWQAMSSARICETLRLQKDCYYIICWPPDGEFQRGLCQNIVHTLHEVSCVVC